MKINKYFLISAAVLILIIGCIIFLPVGGRYRKEIKGGNKIIEKIELYRETKGEYPQNLELISETYNLKIKDIYCYELQEDKYVLWFGTALGEGYYYYSDSNKWEDCLR